MQLRLFLLFLCASLVTALPAQFTCGDEFGNEDQIFPSDLQFINSVSASYQACPQSDDDRVVVTFTDYDRRGGCDGGLVINTNVLRSDGSASNVIDENTTFPLTLTSLASNGCITFQRTERNSCAPPIANWMATVACEPKPECGFFTSAFFGDVTTNTIGLRFFRASGDPALADVEVLPAGTTPTGTPTQEDIAVAMNNSTVTLTGFDPETAYDLYLRADCGDGTTSAFTFLGTQRTLGPPQANDDCGMATDVTVGPGDGACNNPVTIFPAFNTGTGTLPDCQRTETGGRDTWLSFMATQDAAVINLNNGQQSQPSLAAAAPQLFLYSGACASPQLLTCERFSTNLTATGLTVGETYLLRVNIPTGMNPRFYYQYDICINESRTPPANNLCENATDLTPTAADVCNPIAGTTAGATNDGVSTCPSGEFENDVFYSFEAAATDYFVDFTDIASAGGAGGRRLRRLTLPAPATPIPKWG